MPKYMVEASYTAEGLHGLAKDTAAGRRSAATRAVEGVGGKLEAIYFSLGERDVIIICDMPDTVTAAAVSLAASGTGLVRTRTTALLTVEECDQALNMTVKYRAPGKAKK